jgi:hypothetical protein
LLLSTVKGADAAREQLRSALERCATTVDVNEQAWIMRRAFDGVLNAAEDN